MYDDDDRATSWAGGGGWQEPDPPPPPDSPPPPKRQPKVELAPYEEKSRRGLVAGRFLPFHVGHEHLIEVAKRSSRELDVVVFANDADPIPGDTRVEWLRQAFPNVAVYLAVGTDDFKKSIATAIKTPVQKRYDTFYSAEVGPGIAAANAIGATFVPVDPDRQAFPISGTQIREDVMKNFAFISAVARPWFVRRVAVIGPESTGKTELCKRLAHIYSTGFVPEPARALAAARGNTIDAQAIELWLRTQMASEDAVARHANRVVFCDTHSDTVFAWSKRLFDGIQPNAMKATAYRQYDLVILCSADVPFVGTPERDDPAARRALFAELARFSQYDERVVIEGASWQQRVLDARKAVDQLLAGKGFLSKRGVRMIEGKVSG